MSILDKDSRHRSRSEISLSKGWIQGVALVLVFGFFVMGVLAYRTYTHWACQSVCVSGVVTGRG